MTLDFNENVDFNMNSVVMAHGTARGTVRGTVRDTDLR